MTSSQKTERMNSKKDVSKGGTEFSYGRNLKSILKTTTAFLTLSGIMGLGQSALAVPVDHPVAADDSTNVTDIGEIRDGNGLITLNFSVKKSAAAVGGGPDTITFAGNHILTINYDAEASAAAAVLGGGVGQTWESNEHRFHAILSSQAVSQGKIKINSASSIYFVGDLKNHNIGGGAAGAGGFKALQINNNGANKTYKFESAVINAERIEFTNNDRNSTLWFIPNAGDLVFNTTTGITHNKVGTHTPAANSLVFDVSAFNITTPALNQIGTSDLDPALVNTTRFNDITIIGAPIGTADKAITFGDAAAKISHIVAKDINLKLANPLGAVTDKTTTIKIIAADQAKIVGNWVPQDTKGKFDIAISALARLNLSGNIGVTHNGDSTNADSINKFTVTNLAGAANEINLRGALPDAAGGKHKVLYINTKEFHVLDNGANVSTLNFITKNHDLSILGVGNAIEVQNTSFTHVTAAMLALKFDMTENILFNGVQIGSDGLTAEGNLDLTGANLKTIAKIDFIGSETKVAGAADRTTFVWKGRNAGANAAQGGLSFTSDDDIDFKTHTGTGPNVTKAIELVLDTTGSSTEIDITAPNFTTGATNAGVDADNGYNYLTFKSSDQNINITTHEIGNNTANKTSFKAITVDGGTAVTAGTKYTLLKTKYIGSVGGIILKDKGYVKLQSDAAANVNIWAAGMGRKITTTENNKGIAEFVIEAVGPTDIAWSLGATDKKLDKLIINNPVAAAAATALDFTQDYYVNNTVLSGAAAGNVINLTLSKDQDYATNIIKDGLAVDHTVTIKIVDNKTFTGNIGTAAEDRHIKSITFENTVAAGAGADRTITFVGNVYGDIADPVEIIAKESAVGNNKINIVFSAPTTHSNIHAIVYATNNGGVAGDDLTKVGFDLTNGNIEFKGKLGLLAAKIDAGEIKGANTLKLLPTDVFAFSGASAFDITGDATIEISSQHKAGLNIPTGLKFKNLDGKGTIHLNANNNDITIEANNFGSDGGAATALKAFKVSGNQAITNTGVLKIKAKEVEISNTTFTLSQDTSILEVTEKLDVNTKLILTNVSELKTGVNAKINIAGTGTLTLGDGTTASKITLADDNTINIATGGKLEFLANSGGLTAGTNGILNLAGGAKLESSKVDLDLSALTIKITGNNAEINNTAALKIKDLVDSDTNTVNVTTNSNIELTGTTIDKTTINELKLTNGGVEAKASIATRSHESDLIITKATVGPNGNKTTFKGNFNIIELDLSDKTGVELTFAPQAAGKTLISAITQAPRIDNRDAKIIIDGTALAPNTFSNFSFANLAKFEGDIEAKGKVNLNFNNFELKKQLTGLGVGDLPNKGDLTFAGLHLGLTDSTIEGGLKLDNTVASTTLLRNSTIKGNISEIVPGGTLNPKMIINDKSSIEGAINAVNVNFEVENSTLATITSLKSLTLKGDNKITGAIADNQPITLTANSKLTTGFNNIEKTYAGADKTTIILEFGSIATEKGDPFVNYTGNFDDLILSGKTGSRLIMRDVIKAPFKRILPDTSSTELAATALTFKGSTENIELKLSNITIGDENFDKTFNNITFKNHKLAGSAKFYARMMKIEEKVQFTDKDIIKAERIELINNANFIVENAKNTLPHGSLKIETDVDKQGQVELRKLDAGHLVSFGEEKSSMKKVKLVDSDKFNYITSYVEDVEIEGGTVNLASNMAVKNLKLDKDATLSLVRFNNTEKHNVSASDTITLNSAKIMNAVTEVSKDGEMLAGQFTNARQLKTNGLVEYNIHLGRQPGANDKMPKIINNISSIASGIESWKVKCEFDWISMSMKDNGELILNSVDKDKKAEVINRIAEKIPGSNSNNIKTTNDNLQAIFAVTGDSPVARVASKIAAASSTNVEALKGVEILLQQGEQNQIVQDMAKDTSSIADAIISSILQDSGTPAADVIVVSSGDEDQDVKANAWIKFLMGRSKATNQKGSINSSMKGAILGAHITSDMMKAGAAITMGNSDSQIKGLKEGDTAKIDLVMVNGFVGVNLTDQLSANFNLGYGINTVNTSAKRTISGTDQKAVSEYEASILAGSIGFNYNHSFGDKQLFGIRPSFSTKFLNINVPGYQEKGAGDENLKFKERSELSIGFVPGVAVYANLGDVTISMHTNVEISPFDKSLPIEFGMEGLNPDDYLKTDLAEKSMFRFNPGANIGYNYNDVFSLTFGVEGTIAKNYKGVIGSINAKVSF